MCSGKSCLAEQLETKFGAKVIKTRQLIEKTIGRELKTRDEFQQAGDHLDSVDGGKWLVRAVENVLKECDKSTPALVIDSIRIPSQLEELRNTFQVLLTHVHLTADIEALKKRYTDRLSGINEFPNYQEARANSTEMHVEQLEPHADVVIKTDRSLPEDLYTRVVARIGLRPGTAAACVDVLVGGQYGSEGKGNIAHYLAPEYEVLVRVGGTNAGHKVFLASGEAFTFRQLPSGSIANPNATLVLGAGAVLDLKVLLDEIRKLGITSDRLKIDGQAVLIQKTDKNWEKKNLESAIGSTASGVGRASARKVLYRIPGKHPKLAKDEPKLKQFITDTVEFFDECISKGRRILLEGTQGTSLSLHHGYYPHVTSRVTTAAGCIAEAGLAARHIRKVIMVCRTYPIRVGNASNGNTSGHMHQPLTFADIAKRSNIPLEELKATEIGSVTGRQRRIAEFDWSQYRRSIVLNGPTDIALTFADYLSVDNRQAYRYEQLSQETLRFVEELEKVGGIPVSMISVDFSLRNIIDRRAWDGSPLI